jgi:hypothetical protein
MLRQLMQPRTVASKVMTFRTASALNTVLKVRGAQKQAIKRKMTNTITLATTDMM